MLTFEVTTSEQRALDSINKLVHLWTPPTTIPAENLTVSIAENIYNPDSFESALISLKFALPHFGNVVKKCLSHLHTVPAKNLQELYQTGQANQGLRVLLKATHDVLEEKFSLLANHPFQSSVINALDHLCKLQKTVKQTQFSVLKTKLESFRLQIVDDVATFTTTTTFIDKKIVLKNFKYQGSSYALSAQLKASKTFSILDEPCFTDLSTFTFFVNGNMVPLCLNVYPRYPTKHEKPLSLTTFETCDDGASWRFLQSTLSQSEGRLSYQAPQLATVLLGPYADPKYTEVLPLFFQTMVEIAQNHHCYEIVLYIANDFIDKAYALGFYSKDLAEQQQSKKRVKTHLKNGKLPPLLPPSVVQHAEEEELLRPVYFPLSSFNSRPIYLSGQSEATTYKKLCSMLSLLDGPSNSVLPDPYGFMAKPLLSAFRAIKQRQITGHSIKTTISAYCKEPLDANLIKQKKEHLASIGEANVKQPFNKAKILRIIKN